MKKSFKIEDLDCAHCAAKIEDAIKKINGVTDARVNFLVQRLTLEAPDELFDEAFKKAVQIAKRIEPDCTIVG